MPKIYDCFSFFNELDLLELRLNILDPVVDFFVLSEASVTHTGQLKPFYFEENKERFAKFLPKIIHIKVNDVPDKFDEGCPINEMNYEVSKAWGFIKSTTLFNKETEPHYGRDFWQKESIRRGLLNCNDDDIIISSDCDEIPNPEALKKLSTFFDPEKFYSFQQNSYYYYLNMLKETDWFGSRMGTYGKLKNYSYNELRKQTNTPIPNGGWHFSFQGGADKVKHKIESYSAVDMNTDHHKDNIAKNMDEGIDPFFRSKLTLVDIDLTFPKYLRDNLSTYKHMIKNTPKMENSINTQPQPQEEKKELLTVSDIVGAKEVSPITPADTKDEPLVVGLPVYHEPQIKLSKKEPNFLVISNYNNDVSWVNDYENKYVIYDNSDDEVDRSALNVIKSENVGYNLGNFFTFIIDNYDSLPDYTTFCKGNMFPRHMTRQRFEELKDNQFFTPLFDHTYKHTPQLPTCMFSCEGAWSEINNGVGTPPPQTHPTKYIASYNELLKFIFENPLIPNYITFAPGGNYVVPKNNILKYSKIFYQNLKFIISHHQLAGEAHLVERALYTIWMGNFKPNPKCNDKLVNEASFTINKWRSLQTNPLSTTEPPKSVYNVTSDNKNLGIICHIRLKESERPFFPATAVYMKIDNSNFNSLFNNLKLEETKFTFQSEQEAENYLSSNLLPHLKPEANATFAIEKTYKRV